MAIDAASTITWLLRNNAAILTLLKVPIYRYYNLNVPSVKTQIIRTSHML